MMEISKRVLFLNIILSQGLLLGMGFGLWALLRGFYLEVTLLDLIIVRDIAHAAVVYLSGTCILLILQTIFLRTIPWKKLFDGINQLLMERFSLLELIPIFFVGAISEEFLFRGLIQSVLGIWITALIFTLIHYRYWRKSYILLEVFLMGLILGYVFYFSGNLWVPVMCHFSINIITAFLVKKGYIKTEAI
ncbi:CPBP family intramembrane metalloprotease [Dehalobacter sp. DCM]|uniref:CPBP family intramembrane glutamic endopeptidase n=1 Tax=Dehalobacter sp. DCM TaxID=2907827 RepID=UPI003081C788|nr:CPBP family intramembrane metalloprotease [Dehalobacter sp. DCM]